MIDGAKLVRNTYTVTCDAKKYNHQSHYGFDSTYGVTLYTNKLDVGSKFTRTLSCDGDL